MTTLENLIENPDEWEVSRESDDDIAAQRRVSVPVCAHTRTSDFGGPSDGGHTGLPNFRWWYPVCFANLAVCHPKQENPPFLHCSYFIENNIYSHFIAFSSYF